MGGCWGCVCCGNYILLLNYKSEESLNLPSPPYIDENGNIDWDKKYDYENNTPNR